MKKALSVFLSLIISTSMLSYSNCAYAKAAAPKSIVSYAISKSSITVDWSNVSGAKKYYVYMSTSKNGKYKKVATVKKSKCTVKGLSTNKKYYFKVKAKSGSFSSIAKSKTYKKYNASKMNEAYKSVCDSYFSKYGSPTVKRDADNSVYLEWNDIDYSYYVSGVNFIDLIDFNNDGIKELLISYTYYKDGYLSYAYDVYSWISGKATKVLSKMPLQTPEQYGGYKAIEILENDDKTLYAVNMTQDSNGTGYYKYYNGKNFKTKYTFKWIYLADSPSFKVNGKKVSEKKFYSIEITSYFDEYEKKKEKKYDYTVKSTRWILVYALSKTAAEKLYNDTWNTYNSL